MSPRETTDIMQPPRNGIDKVLSMGGAVSYLAYKCRDKTPEELRISAKQYAVQWFLNHVEELPSGKKASPEMSDEAYAFMQHLYLKAQNQETDRTPVEMVPSEPVTPSSGTSSPGIWSSGSSLVSPCSPVGGLPTIPEEPNRSRFSSFYESNSLPG